MANIKDKDINNLSDWNLKELRKLKIMSKNRISALELAPKKEVANSHPLYGMGSEEIKELILQIQRAEKALVK
jgi:hypothetical protein